MNRIQKCPRVQKSNTNISGRNTSSTAKENFVVGFVKIIQHFYQYSVNLEPENLDFGKLHWNYSVVLSMMVPHLMQSLLGQEAVDSFCLSDCFWQ